MIEVILIAAVSDNNVIGIDGKLPWNIPEDMKHFQELTEYHPVIMGRRTYESIGHPLNKRFNIVLSKNYTIPRVITARSLRKALDIASNMKKAIYIIGGEQVYKEAMPFASRLEITRIHQTVCGEAFFPEITDEWKLTTDKKINGHNFMTYIRK